MTRKESINKWSDMAENYLEVVETINEIYDEHEIEIAKLKNKIIKLEANLRVLGAIR